MPEEVRGSRSPGSGVRGSFGLAGMSSGSQTWIHRRVESTNFVIYLHYFSGHFVYNPSFSNFSPPNCRTFFSFQFFFWGGDFDFIWALTCSRVWGPALVHPWSTSDQALRESLSLSPLLPEAISSQKLSSYGCGPMNPSHLSDRMLICLILFMQPYLQ